MSIEYLYFDHERILAWMSDRMGIQQFRDEAVAIGMERNGELVAGVAYDTFGERECLIHVASNGSRRWLTKEFITRTMAYPFLQCNFTRISAFISENNSDSLRFCRHFGFTEEGRARKAGSEGEDLIMFGMLREECSFIQPLIFSTTIR